jgi:hypothetical protein
MIYITVPDMNDSVSSITIDEKQYLIRFTYNGTGDYWSFGISDNDDNPIVTATKIVPNFPLTHFLNFTDLPDGIFGALSDKERITRESFNDGTAEFVYIPWSEVEEG